MSRSSVFRITAAWTHIAGITSLALMLGALPGAASADQPTSLGHAYGSTATLGETVEHGRSALAALSCVGDWAQQSVLEIDAGSHFEIASVTNTVQGEGGKEDRVTTATSVVEGISVLDGLITARAVEAVSITTLESGTFETDGEGSSFASLVVDGYHLGANVAPNTQIALPGVGYVVLNEQIASIGSDAAVLRVNMIHVFVTDVGAPVSVGTEIIVASAFSMLSTRAGHLTGNAHGTAATLPGGVSSDPTALIALGCSGTDGEYISNILAQFDFAPVIETGDMVNTVMGAVSTEWSMADNSSTVQQVALLDGLIVADLVSSRVILMATGGTVEFETEVWFDNLRIAGIPMASTVEPNTRVVLPGVGTVWLNLQGMYGNQKIVRAIQVDVSEANDLGLPIGARVWVAHATAGIK